MRSYAQIAPTFWTRGSGRKLRGNPNAQVLALYFMTAPSSNLIGLYYLPLTTICHETGLAAETVRQTMQLQAMAELVQYDFEQEIVWLPQCARYQIGESMESKDKRRAAVERELLVFEGHRFRIEFDARYGAAFGLRRVENPKGDLRLADAPSKGLPAERMPPFPDPSPVPDLVPVGGAGGAREPALVAVPAEPTPAPDYTDSDEETVIPLDLVERARRHGVFSQLLAHMPGVHLVQLEDKAREFMGYWTIGAGTGQRRRYWMRRFREELRKAHQRNQLTPIGALEHASGGASDARVSNERKRASDAMAAAYASAPKGTGSDG